MARGQCIEIREVLISQIPARRLNRLAREMGALTLPAAPGLAGTVLARHVTALDLVRRPVWSDGVQVGIALDTATQ